MDGLGVREGGADLVDLASAAIRPIAIGFRASAKDVVWAVISVEGDLCSVIEKGREPLPTSFELPGKLVAARKTIKRIALQFEATHAGVKLAELSTRGGPRVAALDRLMVEGVVAESVSALGLKVVVGRTQTLRATINASELSAVMASVDALELRDVPSQAVLAAVSALASGAE